jgi:hypothetical protein
LVKQTYTPDIIRAKDLIDQLEQQIEAANSKDKRCLQHQLKELQILHHWQLSQMDRQGDEAK